MGIESEVSKLGTIRDAVAVAKSDTTVLAGVRGLWIGGAGDLTLTFPSGDTVFKGAAAGQLLPLAPSKVKTATTATDIVALY